MTAPVRECRVIDRFPPATWHPEGTCDVCDDRRDRKWRYVEENHQ